MLRYDLRSLEVGCLLIVILFDSASAAQTDSSVHEETIERALVLLPRRPAKVLVVDVTRAARAADGHGRRVQAFVRAGENVVYLVAQGEALRQGQKGRGVFDYVLATLIWHEMAHLAGADEPDAQRQEEELWKQYVAAGQVDMGRGLNYLALLRQRSRPAVMATLCAHWSPTFGPSDTRSNYTRPRRSPAARTVLKRCP